MLIKNICRSYNLSGPLKAPFSIRIDTAGNISAVGDIPDTPEPERIVDATGLCISPGWIDLHTHIYQGVSDAGIDPDLIGPAQGVSVLVDAGSAGHITFPGLRDYIIKKRNYEIYAFLNYGSIGITRANYIGDFETDAFIQPRETLACIEQNRSYIRGLKVRACKAVLKGRLGCELVKAAADLAQEAKAPLMVHIGEPGPRLEDILKTLHQGDIVTHSFHSKGNIVDPSTGKIIQAAYAARERGVLFDVGHGAASFDIDIGRKSIAQGFKPDLVSTDLYARSFPKPVESLAVTMTKMISCGLEPEEVIDMVTRRAAGVLGLDRRGLEQGCRACFTLFKITDHIQIEPVMTILGADTYGAS
ncbi:deacetylase [Spirochaetia bacterium]|nr:deacetylase [Spirochaetia bacterium]